MSRLVRSGAWFLGIGSCVRGSGEVLRSLALTSEIHGGPSGLMRYRRSVTGAVEQ